MNLQEVARQLHGQCGELRVGESKNFTLNPPLERMDRAVLQIELGQMGEGAETHLDMAFCDATVTVFRVETRKP